MEFYNGTNGHLTGMDLESPVGIFEGWNLESHPFTMVFDSLGIRPFSALHDNLVDYGLPGLTSSIPNFFDWYGLGIPIGVAVSWPGFLVGGSGYSATTGFDNFVRGY